MDVFDCVKVLSICAHVHANEHTCTCNVHMQRVTGLHRRVSCSRSLALASDLVRSARARALSYAVSVLFRVLVCF